MKLIVSSLPGRMRIRNANLRGDRHRLVELRDRLKAFDPDCEIDINPVSGSLLVHYDCDGTPRGAMERAVHDAFEGMLGARRLRKHHYTPVTLKLNRYAKYGMYSTLGLTLWLAAARARRPHAVAGWLFVACLGLHLAVHRHRLLS